MSEANVEVVRRVLDAFAQRDPETAWAMAVELLDPQMKMDMTRLDVPGLARKYIGLKEVAEFWQQWLEAWGSLGVLEDVELRDAGEQVVMWPSRQILKGKGSGIAVEMPEYAWTMVVKDGKVKRATIFMSKDAALEAAGLRE